MEAMAEWGLKEGWKQKRGIQMRGHVGSGWVQLGARDTEGVAGRLG